MQKRKEATGLEPVVKKVTSQKKEKLPALPIELQYFPILMPEKVKNALMAETEPRYFSLGVSNLIYLSALTYINEGRYRRNHGRRH